MWQHREALLFGVLCVLLASGVAAAVAGLASVATIGWVAATMLGLLYSTAQGAEGPYSFSRTAIA
jgi:hypothetical protein